jgi:hypothetical protein
MERSKNRQVQSVADLKRLCKLPGTTLQRLCVNGYDNKPPRTIQTVKTRYIIFSDGAQLTFPTAEQFKCFGNIVKWNNLYFNVALKESN